VRNKENAGDRFGSKKNKVVIEEMNHTRKTEFKKKTENNENIAGVRMHKKDRIG
jgi:hypothetical protein